MKKIHSLLLIAAFVAFGVSSARAEDEGVKIEVVNSYDVVNHIGEALVFERFDLHYIAGFTGEVIADQVPQIIGKPSGGFVTKVFHPPVRYSKTY